MSPILGGLYVLMEISERILYSKEGRFNGAVTFGNLIPHSGIMKSYIPPIYTESLGVAIRSAENVVLTFHEEEKRERKYFEVAYFFFSCRPICFFVSI